MQAASHDSIKVLKHTITKHKQFFSLASSYLPQKGKEVERYAQRIFAHDAARMRARWVEVTQQRSIPLREWLSRLLQVIALCLNVIRYDHFNCGLRAPIRICRPNRAVLGDGYHVGESSSIAIHRRRRRENDISNVVFRHTPK